MQDRTSLTPDISEQIKNIRQKMANFIVDAEFSRQASASQHFASELDFENKEAPINEQVLKLNHELSQLRQFMTDSGALQWCRTIEDLAHTNKAALQHFETLYRDLSLSITASCEKLNITSITTAKNFAQIMSTTRETALKKLTEQNTLDLKEACSSSLDRVGHMVQTFHWRNTVMIVFLTFMISLIMSLYMNHELPWQTRAQAIKERDAGKVLTNAWSGVSQKDQKTLPENP